MNVNGPTIGYISPLTRRQQKYSGNLQASDRVNLRFLRGIRWDLTRRHRVDVTASNGCDLAATLRRPLVAFCLHHYECLRGRNRQGNAQPLTEP